MQVHRVRHSRVLVARPRIHVPRPPSIAPSQWTGWLFWRHGFSRWRDRRVGACCYSSLLCTSRTRAPAYPSQGGGWHGWLVAAGLRCCPNARSSRCRVGRVNARLAWRAETIRGWARPPPSPVFSPRLRSTAPSPWTDSIGGRPYHANSGGPPCLKRGRGGRGGPGETRVI